MMNDWKETQDTGETKPQPDAKPTFGETGKQSMQGPEVPPLTTEAKGDIIDIRHLPVDQRPQAVADFRNSKAGKQAGDLNSGVMRDGKGVYFDDADGRRYEIPYEEDKKDSA
jgi:hypothetical protein